MTRRFIAALLIALFIAPASASTGASTPSSVMAGIGKLKDGRSSKMTFTVNIETTDKAAADRCLKIFSENGMKAKMTVTSGSSLPKDVYKLEASKEYVAADASADKILGQSTAAGRPDKVSWTVSQTVAGF